MAITGFVKGEDVPVILTNLPEGSEIKRLDFEQKKVIIVTKTGSDIIIDGNTGYTELTQEDTLKFDEKRTVEVQLSFVLGGKAKRTLIKSFYVARAEYKGVI